MNKLRFRSGQVHLRKVPVQSNTVIYAGDLLWLDQGHARPASEFAWTTDLETTQAGFAALFLGVAHQPSAAGESQPVSVDVSPDSVYEFDVASAAYKFGEALGPATAGASKLSSQVLVSAAKKASIARAAEFTAVSGGLLRLTFASAFHSSSANHHAILGQPEPAPEA